MGEEVGVAYVRLLPSMRGFSKLAKRQISDAVSGPSRKAGEESGRSFGDRFARESERSIHDRMGNVARKALRGFGSVLGVTAKPTAVTVATAFSAQFFASLASAFASGAVKLAHGFAAGLALLPAAALAGGLALVTLKVAISGVGDALSAGLTGDTEKFEEALKGLAPAAQTVAREIVGVKGQLDSLKGLVQQNFFAPLVGQVRPLAEIYLRQLHLVLGDLARTFGQVGSQISSFLQTPDVFRSIFASLTNAKIAVTNLALGVGNLVQAFLPLVAVGSTFLPRLTDGFGSATARLASFMREAEKTGKLRDFIQGGIDKLRSLWETTKQVGRIVGNLGDVFSKAFASGGGLLAGLGLETGGMLDAFERMTEKAADFIDTAAGSEKVAEVFATVRAVLGAVFGTFQRLAPIVARVFGPILPEITAAAEAIVNLSSSIVEALEPALGVASNLLGLILPPLTDLVNLLARNEPLLQGIGIAIATILAPAFALWAVNAALAAAATLLAMAPIILIGVAVAALATLFIIHWNTIKNAILGVFNWIKTNWPLVLAILTGPIGLAVLAITKHWDKIRAGISAVKDWIGARLREVGGFFARLPSQIAQPIARAFNSFMNAATKARDWVGQRISDVARAFADLPRRIGRALGALGSAIAAPFKAAFRGVADAWNAGPGGFGFTLPSWIPGVGGKGFRIPSMHTGGIFEATGGSEGLALLEHGEGVFTREQMAAIGSSVAQPGAGAVLVLDAAGADRRFVEFLRHFIRVKGGGSVQVALGQ